MIRVDAIKVRTYGVRVNSHCGDWRRPFMVNFVDVLVDIAMVQQPVSVVESELVNDSHEDQIEDELWAGAHCSNIRSQTTRLAEQIK